MIKDFVSKNNHKLHLQLSFDFISRAIWVELDDNNPLKQERLEVILKFTGLQCVSRKSTQVIL